MYLIFLGEFYINWSWTLFLFVEILNFCLYKNLNNKKNLIHVYKVTLKLSNFSFLYFMHLKIFVWKILNQLEKKNDEKFCFLISMLRKILWQRNVESSMLKYNFCICVVYAG